jgi:hypothetical protein
LPTGLRGRIAGFYTMAFLGMAPLGYIRRPVAIAGVVGVQATFAANGLVAAVASALVLAATAERCAS